MGPEHLTREFPDDAFLRWQLVTDAVDGPPADAGTVDGDAWAWTSGQAWGRYDVVTGSSRLIVGGDAADAAALTTALVPDLLGAGRRPDRVSVVREAVDLLEPALRPIGGDDWDWFATTTAPSGPSTPSGPAAPSAPSGPSAPSTPLPGEERVARVDTADPAVLDAVVELLEGHSPRFSRDPRRSGASWWAIAADGQPGYAAVTAVEPLPRAVHLASIATRTDLRGTGLASALTAAVTRSSLADGAEAVVLGMYADNDTARRLYRRLGFRDSHHWRSGRLAA